MLLFLLSSLYDIRQYSSVNDRMYKLQANNNVYRSLLELNNFSPYVFLVSVIQLSGISEWGLLSDVIQLRVSTSRLVIER